MKTHVTESSFEGLYMYEYGLVPFCRPTFLQASAQDFAHIRSNQACERLTIIWLHRYSIDKYQWLQQNISIARQSIRSNSDI